MTSRTPPTRRGHSSACSLRGKVEGQSEPKAAVGWSDDPEIGRPDREDVRVRTEESEPELWETGGEESDTARDRGRESCTTPRPRAARVLGGQHRYSYQP